jgi:hypothetical protein
MFKDFETTKIHLNELAEIINKFKSEAVQLRLVELLFEGSVAGQTGTTEQEAPHREAQRKRKKRSRLPSKEQNATTRKKRTSSGSGAVATLLKTFEEGYFKQPRTIGDICKHCETNLARRIKPNEISGKLGRMVRDRQLSRTKNADSQYVYTST